MKAYVKNASDSKQVREAEKKVRFDRTSELDDIKAVLSNPQGRRFLWKLLAHCRVSESIWHPSALIHYNAGIQDVGHFIQAEIVAADQDAYIKMMVENREEIGVAGQDARIQKSRPINKGENVFD